MACLKVIADSLEEKTALCRMSGKFKKEVFTIVIILSLLLAPVYIIHISAFASIPSPPNHLASYPFSNKTINLSWNASSGATSYTIYRNYSSTIGFVPIAVNVKNTIYIDKDPSLMEGVRYGYAVSAKNSSGESAQSITTYSVPYTTIILQNILISFGISTLIVIMLCVIVYEIIRYARKQKLKEARKKEDKDVSIAKSAAMDDTSKENEKRNKNNILASWRFWDIVRGNDWYPSLSLFQLFLWTVVIVFSFLFMAIIMLQHGISPPVKSLNTPMLLALLGISVASPIVSSALSSTKYASNSAGEPPEELEKFSTMLEEGSKPSVTRFQMFVWTWIGILVFFITVLNTLNSNINNVSQLAVPDVDPVLVALMGMSQISYLGGKAISNTPSIGSIYPRVIDTSDISDEGQIVSIFGKGFGDNVPRGAVWIGTEYFEYPDDDTKSNVAQPNYAQGNITTIKTRKILGWTDDRIDIKISQVFPGPGSYYVRVASPSALVKYEKPLVVRLTNPSKVIQQIISIINNMNLSSDDSSSLNSQLISAKNLLDSGQKIEAKNQLNQFIDYINEQKVKSITFSQAYPLITLTQYAINSTS